ncbi:MAG: metal-dependent hydrolase [Clostridia bacterium]|jgi:L-ascorbate metabolism protein UlaG (beta-lactamase superfamily)|nr:metal-dependent hydrolase [Clostridia bacterium]
MLKLIYHGHACFSITDGTYDLLIDPFLNDNPLADVKAHEVNPSYILLTHGHNDHFGDALEIAKRTGAMIIAPYELAIYCEQHGVKTAAMNPGGSKQFPFGKIKLTPAWHSSSIIKGNNIIYTGAPCGFLIEIQGKIIYHAGDTGLFGDMKLIGDRYRLNFALLPIGDIFVMGPEDAIEAAVMLQAQVTIPMHYNTFPLIAQDPDLFVEKLRSKGLKGLVLKAGEQSEL